jgi:isopentenyl diphosphate isomerase/L-lactate dehydrogenase-like FMN-dependent dehydrogenase
MVLLGRAFCYGVGALGPREGPREVVRIVGEELDRAMALLGCRDVRGFGTARHRS